MQRSTTWVWDVGCGHSYCFFFSSRRRHTRLQGDWSSDVCSSDLNTHSGPGWRKTFTRIFSGTVSRRISSATALIYALSRRCWATPIFRPRKSIRMSRSEEHTSELQSPCNLVCRLLLEKKKKNEY